MGDERGGGGGGTLRQKEGVETKLLIKEKE